MHIYFARSIRGDRQSGHNLMLKAIEQEIHFAACETQFGLKVIPAGSGLDTDTYIYQRDIGWIDQCQAMIAEVTAPSHGVGYEIAYAQYVRKIPVLCLYEKDSNVSAMIRGSQQVIAYRDRIHLGALIQSFIDGLKESAHADQEQS